MGIVMEPLQQLDLGHMVDIVQRDSHEKIGAAVIPLAPRRLLVEAGRSEVSDGTDGQFDGARGNPPLGPSTIFRCTMYFQYAMWSVSAQMECRSGPGSHAALSGDTPLSTPRTFPPPCQSRVPAGGSR